MAAEAGKERLFVGVPLPRGLVPAVERTQAELPPVRGLRLLTTEQLHVTLAFIGEVGTQSREAARAVVAEVPEGLGGTVGLGGIVLLPSPRRVRVVAMGVHDPDGLFTALFEHVMSGLESATVMQREKRPFLPHLTIARLRDPVALQPKSEGGSGPFPIESVCLYRSELRREGARYAVLERRALVGGRVRHSREEE